MRSGPRSWTFSEHFTGGSCRGAVVSGKPAVTVGTDDAAYIAVRDPFNSMWMGRQSGLTFQGWQPGGGVLATDPQVAAAGGNIYAAALSASGAVWYNVFVQGTGNNWQAGNRRVGR